MEKIFTASLFGIMTVVVPVFFFTRIKDSTKRFNTSIVSVIIIVASGLLFAISQLKNSPVVDATIQKLFYTSKNQL
jgi:hypothetical protein